VKTKEKIGLVESHVGLYVLRPEAFHTSPSLCSSKANTLWHSHLGHPSHELLHLLDHKYSYNVADNPNICDVCHKSKQKKLPFSLSTSNTLMKD